MFAIDVAAYGLDIPLLDNFNKIILSTTTFLLNFWFTELVKTNSNSLFRCGIGRLIDPTGRVAKAERYGTASSLFALYEIPLFVDLHFFFLCRPLKFISKDGLHSRLRRIPRPCRSELHLQQCHETMAQVGRFRWFERMTSCFQMSSKSVVIPSHYANRLNVPKRSTC
jgi:hypothetical protein